MRVGVGRRPAPALQHGDRDAGRDLALADGTESAPLIQGERGAVGGSGGDHGQAGRFLGIQAVQQCGCDALAVRAGMDNQPADVQGPVGQPSPGHRPGQAGLVRHAKERLTAIAQFLERFAERRDGIESDEAGLHGVGGALKLP